MDDELVEGIHKAADSTEPLISLRDLLKTRGECEIAYEKTANGSVHIFDKTKHDTDYTIIVVVTFLGTIFVFYVVFTRWYGAAHRNKMEERKATLEDRKATLEEADAAHRREMQKAEAAHKRELQKALFQFAKENVASGKATGTQALEAMLSTLKPDGVGENALVDLVQVEAQDTD